MAALKEYLPLSRVELLRGCYKPVTGTKQKNLCAYEGMEKYFPADKLVLTGNPVREDLINPGIPASQACAHFNLEPGKPVLLVLGGSLGALTINNSLLQQAEVFDQENIQLLWQTGKLYYKRIQEELNKKALKHVRYVAFINRMDLAYAAADVIVSRAGAGTISSYACWQTCNPGSFTQCGEDHRQKCHGPGENDAALMITDAEALQKLVAEACKLILDETLKKTLGSNCKKMALPGSASKIVDEIVKVTKAT
jgi:UDP-N-acetylglucosamine--N-acetylmuramyl-(pentapeptide) pyrophosphoryl-undecaprenol N-acetylglucosamine transferase